VSVGHATCTYQRSHNLLAVEQIPSLKIYPANLAEGEARRHASLPVMAASQIGLSRNKSSGHRLGGGWQRSACSQVAAM
jgi:hypothetical protein